MVRLGLWILRRRPQRWSAVFTTHQGYLLSTWHIPDDLLTTVVFACFSTVQLLSMPEYWQQVTVLFGNQTCYSPESCCNSSVMVVSRDQRIWVSDSLGAVTAPVLDIKRAKHKLCGPSHWDVTVHLLQHQSLVKFNQKHLYSVLASYFVLLFQHCFGY